jgi:outer membrane protein insertion porin family
MKRKSKFIYYKTAVGFFLRVLSAVMLMSCTAGKYLEEGQKYYAGSEIKFETKDRVGGKKRVEETLLSLVTQQPNTKVLGMRPGVWLYFRQRDATKKKGLKAFIRRKFGQVPIYLEELEPDKTAELFVGQLANDGYFNSEVQWKKKEHKNEGKIIYTVFLEPPYRLREVTFPKPKDSLYSGIIRSLKKNTIVKPGQRYELARLQAEQARIETEVKDFGIYYFDDRYLIYEADSTVGDKEMDIDLKMEAGIPDKGKWIYRVSEVNVYPDFSINNDTTVLKRNLEVADSMNFYYRIRSFRPKVLTRTINIRKNNIYSRSDHTLTLSHLMDLGVFKFVNIQYNEVSADTSLLRANIFLTPLKRNSIRAEFQLVSKSNSFAGPGLDVTFTNRNLLHGAEMLQVKLNTSYEVQISKNLAGPLNAFEVGMETSLTVPRFITPIRIDYSSKKFLPKTDFRLGYDLEVRVGYFRLNSLSLGAGYLWRESESKSHALYPIDISFVKTGSSSAEFTDILAKNPFLQTSFTDQFILGTRYSYTINTQLKPDLVQEFRERRLKKHSIFFNGNVQLSGNMLHLIQQQFHDNEVDTFRLFGYPYSQFVRGDVDFRYYWQLDRHSKLASRVIVGTGYALGNSSVMPYIRQFSTGGSNSVRAFPARSIGPGSYYILADPQYNGESDGEETPLPAFIDQRGDIKLESSVELRFDILKALKGAVFADAGNIWLWREDEREGAKISNDFLSELAVGTGLGIRLDMNFFVLRLDVAFPLRKPWYEKGNRWVIDEINFSSPTWRGDNIIYNLAIGYPF